MTNQSLIQKAKGLVERHPESITLSERYTRYWMQKRREMRHALFMEEHRSWQSS